MQLGRLDLTSDSNPGWCTAEDLYDELLKSSSAAQATAEYKSSRAKALRLSCGLLIGIRTFAS